MERKRIKRKNKIRLALVCFVIGIGTALLAFSLKFITEHVQHIFYDYANEANKLFFVIMPSIGITMIYFLRKYFFKNRKNKGITEIYKTLDQRKDHLPFFKIPSHYVNGFLTVVFGGSTGIEVSTVVASATVGNAVYKKQFSANVYKLELICAGVTAGVAILFGSPIVGWLFAMEVIARKYSQTLVISCTSAAIASGILLYFSHPEPLIPFAVGSWKWVALPFFIILSLLGSLLSVYFTVLVIWLKTFFSGLQNNFIRVNLGALIVGTLILCFPFIYGDSYHGLSLILDGHHYYPILMIALLIILKPLASALTLGAGGDGGVFAPSIVAGAFLGFAFAQLCNSYFGTSLIPLNFMLAGAASTLSAAIYAPYTALFLACGLAPQGFHLFFPLVICSLLAQFIAKKILPYNVYTYNAEKAL